jgi:hypothetical protein
MTENAKIHVYSKDYPCAVVKEKKCRQPKGPRG